MGRTPAQFYDKQIGFRNIHKVLWSKILENNLGGTQTQLHEKQVGFVDILEFCTDLQIKSIRDYTNQSQKYPRTFHPKCISF